MTHAQEAVNPQLGETFRFPDGHRYGGRAFPITNVDAVYSDATGTVYALTPDPGGPTDYLLAVVLPTVVGEITQRALDRFYS